MAGHARARTIHSGRAGDGALAGCAAGEGRRNGRQKEEKVMPRLVRTEEGQSGGSSSGSELRSACPWRTRSGARVRHRGRGRRRVGRAERRVRALRCSLLTQAGAGGFGGAPSTRGAEARSMATACLIWGPPSNTWCAREFPTFSVQNGIFGLDSDLGACSKVVVHKLLSNFY